MQGSPVRNPCPLQQGIAQRNSVGLENEDILFTVRVWGCEDSEVLLLCRPGVLSSQ